MLVRATPSDATVTGHVISRRAVLRGSAALLIARGLISGSRTFAAGLRVGEPAPPATLVTLEGERISTADLLGQVTILTFWATWCAPCRAELPLLSQYAAEHASEGLRVLGFSLDLPEDLRAVQQVAQTLRFPVGLMANSSAPGYGRIWRLPVNFTIDRTGRLAENGWRDKKPQWTVERLDQIVTPLLR